MPDTLGVNVYEVDGTAPPVLVPAPLSTAGLLIVSPRGAPNLPVKVRGVADFTARFGGYLPGAFGAHAVKGFFDNGGSEAYVVRVAAAGARAAAVPLTDRATTPLATLEVRAGALGREDPGVWGNALAVKVQDRPRSAQLLPAQIVGAKAEPFALQDGQRVTVTVNGSSAQTDTFTVRAADFANLAAASAAEVAAAINRQVTRTRAAVTPDQKLLLVGPDVDDPTAVPRLDVADGTTGPPGGAAALAFSGDTASSDAGLPAGATLVAVSSTAGLAPGSAVRLESHGVVVGKKPVGATVANQHAINVTADGAAPVAVAFLDTDFHTPAAVTPGEVVAVINRQARGFTAALTHDNRLVLFSNTTGPNSSLTVSPPATPANDATKELGLDTAVAQAGTRTFLPIDRVVEKGRYVTWPKSAAPGAALAPPFPRLQSAEFDLVVVRVDRDGRQTELERFESVSMEGTVPWNVVAAVNDPGTGSRYVVVTDRKSASAPGLNAPAAGTFPLSGAPAGADGTDDPPADLDFIGDPAARTGLHAFDRVAVQLLACPETTSKAVVAACLTYCEARGDLMFVGSAGPAGAPPAALKTFVSALRARKVYGALYAPRIKVLNPLDAAGTSPLVLIPPDGHVLGVYARTADRRGVWKAPAGDEAVLNNALGVEFEMTDADHTDLVKNGGVNGVRTVPGAGVVIDASRTLSTDPRWLFVGTRRLFNYVKASLRDGLRWVAQEPHTEELRRKVRFNVVRPFLLGLWRGGAFGSSPPDKVFTVKCDAENNPAADVQQGTFNVEVYFYPVKPAETIVIQVGQQESGATALEPRA